MYVPLLYLMRLLPHQFDIWWLVGKNAGGPFRSFLSSDSHPQGSKVSKPPRVFFPLSAANLTISPTKPVDAAPLPPFPGQSGRMDGVRLCSLTRNLTREREARCAIFCPLR